MCACVHVCVCVCVSGGQTLTSSDYYPPPPLGLICSDILYNSWWHQMKWHIRKFRHRVTIQCKPQHYNRVPHLISFVISEFTKELQICPSGSNMYVLQDVCTDTDAHDTHPHTYTHTYTHPPIHTAKERASAWHPHNTTCPCVHNQWSLN